MRGHGARRIALILALVFATAAVGLLAEAHDHARHATADNRAAAMSGPWTGVGEAATVVKADGQAPRITDRRSAHHDYWSFAAVLTAILVPVVLAGATVLRPTALAVASLFAGRAPARGPPSPPFVLG